MSDDTWDRDGDALADLIEADPEVQRLRRQADEWDEQAAARAAYGDYVRELKRRVDAPAIAAGLKRAKHRAEVHRLRHREGKSIAQAVIATELKHRYVVELGMDVEPSCTEECINDPRRIERRRKRGEM